MADDVLDLHDLAVLLNYERASTDPRFRYAKLREVASDTSPFKTVKFFVPDWDAYRQDKAGFVFDAHRPKSKEARAVRDLPSNMLPDPVPENLRALTIREVETIYWRARGHDACYKAVSLLQHFFDLYPDDKRIRVRTADGKQFVTSVSTRVILEFIFEDPSFMTLSAVLPENKMYVLGEADTLLHAIVGFGVSKEGNVSTVLDLASLQMGEAGRGDGGNGTFALESLDKFYDRIEQVVGGCDTSKTKTSGRIGPCPDDKWLKGVAARTKARWENREQEPWCSFCGISDVSLKKCSVCRKVVYCGREHQTADWAFHKKFCRKAGNEE